MTEAISWSSQVSWFREQSLQSLDVLKEQLRDPIDAQLIEVFDEIETSASDLALPKDFLELCEHYELDRPSLLSLVLSISVQYFPPFSAQHFPLSLPVDACLFAA